MTPYHKIHDFHGARALGVGSSDIPTLAGFAKQYGQTPYTLWRQKVGMDGPTEAGPRAEWGHRLEPLVLSAYIERHYGQAQALAYLAAAIRGRSCGPYKTLTEAIHPERRYVLAHADLVIDDEAAQIIEAKTSGYYAGKRREGEAFLGYDPDDLTAQGIPDPVYLQVQWQLYAYDVREAWVAVLIDTGDYREYGPIIADPRTQEKCLTLATRLWECVEANKPPKPETWSDVATMWPLPDEKTAMVGGETEMQARQWCDEYHRLGETERRVKDRRTELKNALGILIGENSVLATAEGVKLASSWIQSNPRQVDLKKLETEMPDIFSRLVEAEIITQTQRRELRPAKIKGD
jgi:predicted phage-related endonuclease